MLRIGHCRAGSQGGGEQDEYGSMVSLVHPHATAHSRSCRGGQVPHHERDAAVLDLVRDFLASIR